MNDPNGLVHFAGEYHLYYQYNPLGDQWGHISWGHAVSRDLVSWQELEVAIPATDEVMAFSGSVIVDHDNASGFAPEGSIAPPMVAFFTGFNPQTKIQSQHVAYSLDRGRTYTPYAGNPIIDIGSKEFRDPKVFWHAPTRRWVMLVVAALRQEMWIYTSINLKDWTRTSTFGPAGSAANNIWEVPDLFELPVDGDAARTRWVLVISVNHGSLWGGSGVQYFIGDFDGARFTQDPSAAGLAVQAPTGDLIADFDGGGLPAGWHSSGTAFGPGPVSGALDGQQFVSGHLGPGVMNSFHGGDRSTGTLSSPSFVITRPWLNFKIAGGRSALTRLELRVGQRVVHQASGDDTEVLKWRSWDVSAFVGQEAVLHAVDDATGAWGHLLLDHVVMSDMPMEQVSNSDITLWADHGRDFYAPITFSNVPDGRVLWLGWMNNWDYARDLPTQPWRGQQSGVRELGLVSTSRGLRLRQRMAAEFRDLIDASPWLVVRQQPATGIDKTLQALVPSSRHYVVRLELSSENLSAPVGLELFKDRAGSVKVGFDPGSNRFFIDRRSSTWRFAGYSERHEALRCSDALHITLEIWVDGSTIECFADDGTVVLSDLVYTAPDAMRIGLFHGVEDPQIQLLDLRPVRAVMHP